MAFFGNKRKDFSIQPPKQQVDGTPFFVTDSANIDFTLANLNLTANLTQTGVTAGTYGSSTLIPILTLDSYGRVTGISTTTFSAAGILLQTNTVTNPTQTILNLIQGTNMTITDDGLGNITFDATGGGGSVTAVTATSPITSSGGATPDISTSMATNKLIGRGTAGTGVMEEITLGTGLSLSGTTLNATGGGVTSVGLSMPSAFTVAGSPILTSGTLAVTGAGTTSQYVRGDGSLATYNPGTGGGGASVSYYLNGSVSQGTFGGVAMREINKVPVIGAGTDFTINADGYIQSFITDAGDPNQLAIPGGNWNFEMFFHASSGGGSPSFYIELYKWDGAALTLIASNSATPENITGGTSIDLYTTAVAVPQTTLALTDRLAIRVYVIHSGRTITLHTEDSHLCQIITTFTTGLTALNGLTDQVQNFASTDLNILSSVATHNFSIANNAVTYAKMQNASAIKKLLGSNDASASITEIILGTNLTMSGNTLNATGGGGDSIGQLTGDVDTILATSSTEVMPSTLAASYKKGGASVVFDGAGGVITSGTTGYAQVPYNGTIASWTIVSSVSGSCTVTVFKDTYANFPPIISTDNVFTVQPALVTQVKNQNLSPTFVGSQATVTAGDYIGFTISGVSTVAWVNLTLSITKTV